MTKETFTWTEFQKMSERRSKEGFKRPLYGEDAWSMMDWSIALTGEIGEFSNFLKKVKRGDYSLQTAKWDISKELADIISYAVLTMSYLGGATEPWLKFQKAPYLTQFPESIDDPAGLSLVAVQIAQLNGTIAGAVEWYKLDAPFYKVEPVLRALTTIIQLCVNGLFYLGLHPFEQIMNKFNEVSERIGWKYDLAKYGLMYNPTTYTETRIRELYMSAPQTAIRFGHHDPDNSFEEPTSHSETLKFYETKNSKQARCKRGHAAGSDPNCPVCCGCS